MNPESADQALDSAMNVDEEWMQQFHRGQTKPPDPGLSRSTMEMELINIINTANKPSRMIASPAINTGAMGSCDLAAGLQSELEMRRVAVSVINSVAVDATYVTSTAVPRSSCNLFVTNVSASTNTSVLHKISSVFSRSRRGGAAAAAAGDLYRGAGVGKVKKKRVRPSRRVPTTVLMTDTSNFKAMVEHFTGIPSTCSFTQESIAAPSASSSFPQSISSASSLSFSKISNSSSGSPAPASSHSEKQTMPLVDAVFFEELRDS